jgi:antitoxin VapB
LSSRCASGWRACGGGHGRRLLSEELREIGERCAALPTLDDRTEDEILGYDENGLPR